jgi:transcription termination factor NusB
MTNNTTTNETLEVVSDSGMLDMLMDNMMYIGGAAVLVALGCAVAWMKVPAFRMYARKMYAKLMRQHKDEMEELYEKYLTKAMKAKLNATQKAKVQAAILEKAILSEVDHKVVKTSKAIAKEIREMAKKL